VLLVLLAVVLALAASEIVLRTLRIVRNVGPSFTVWHAHNGVALKRSYQCSRIAPEFHMQFSSNADGWRGPELARDGRPVLFCLGDSFTMGYGVDDGEEYAALVRTHFGGGIDVANAGIGGTGNGRWLNVLTQEAKPLAPAVVLLQVCGNDFVDNVNERLYQLGDGGELQALPVPRPSLLRRLQPLLDNTPVLPYLHTVSLIRQLPGMVPDEAVWESFTPSRDGTGPGDRLTLALVRRALAICAEQRWPVLGLSVALHASEQQWLERLFGEFGHRFLVIPDRATEPEHYFAVDGHWNKRGHAAVAARVARALEEAPYRQALVR
jgi:hypothetical protein